MSTALLLHAAATLAMTGLIWFVQKRHARTLEAARDAQRSGKIPLYANLIAESEAIAEKIDALRRRAERVGDPRSRRGDHP